MQGKVLAQPHTASEFQSLDSNPGSSTLPSAFLPLENGADVTQDDMGGPVVWER